MSAGDALEVAVAARGWRVVRSRGPAGELHQRDVTPGGGRELWVHEVTRPALVLGSAQDEADVDLGAARAAGVEVVRRRSGGGAVLVEPGGVVWVDVVIPPDDPEALDDVVRAAGWVGEVWADALLGLGLEDVRLHRGPAERSALARSVCFGGLGPGEVVVADRKVVGVAQRRTRAGTRFQCAVLLRWEPDRLVGLVRTSDPAATRAALARAAAPVGRPAAEVLAALGAALGRREAPRATPSRRGWGEGGG